MQYDKAVTLAYLPLSDLGIYNPTYTAFTVPVTIATALGSALLPYYGMAYRRNDHQRALARFFLWLRTREKGKQR